MNNSKIITIDGPSGVGKGTLAKALAKHFDYKLLDSGAIYRLAALHCYKNNINFDSEKDVYKILESLDIEFQIDGELLKAFLSKNEVTKEIYTEQTGLLASKIAAYSSVRETLLSKQQDFATEKGLIADGRDMGTVVFKNAKHKFFLDASPEIRAKRRFDQLSQKQQNPNFETILTSIQKRDYQDRNRKTAPLKPAEDAKIIDTSNLAINEVLTKVINEINLK